MPLVAVVQYLGLMPTLGPAAAVTGLVLAWMPAGGLYTLALQHRPQQIRAIDDGIGGMAVVLTAIGSLVEWAH